MHDTLIVIMYLFHYLSFWSVKSGKKMTLFYCTVALKLTTVPVGPQHKFANYKNELMSDK